MQKLHTNFNIDTDFFLVKGPVHIHSHIRSLIQNKNFPQLCEDSVELLEIILSSRDRN